MSPEAGASVADQLIDLAGGNAAYLEMYLLPSIAGWAGDSAGGSFFPAMQQRLQGFVDSRSAMADAAASEVLRPVLQPVDLFMSGASIAQGNGGWGDYANVTLAVVPGVAGVLGKAGRVAAESIGDIAWIGKNRVTFQGIEVRAVRDLSHMTDSTLKAMAKRGFSGKTADGESIVLHHHQQNPDGFIVELPASKHSIGNVNQHPYGNAKGTGLTTEQRTAFDTWRVDYWKARAQTELRRRVGQ